MTLQDVKDISKKIDDAELVYNSTADWERKYDIIFHMDVWQTIRKAGCDFEWYDPDTTEQEDVTAYMEALLEFRKSLGNLNDISG